MNVLILAGSPRRNGNSDMLCEQFAAGARESGHEVEMIRIQDLGLHFCLGCDHCKRNAGACVHQDGMAETLEKMIRAEVIVLATPVYFYTMDGQMKTLIDRTYARYLEIRGKEFHVILTAADSNLRSMERTVEGFRGFFSCLENAVEKSVIYGVGAWAKGDIATSPTVRQAFKTGRGLGNSAVPARHGN